MTIHGSEGWFTKLGSDGQPVGPRVPFGENAVAFSAEGPECAYGDPACPCQDGDTCHYEGPDPMTPWRTITIELTALDLRTAYLLFGSRRVFGYPRPLAINGREYRRRARRR